MKDEIFEIVSEELGVALKDVNESTKLDDVAQDSIDVIGLIAALSSHFKMRVEPKALAGIKTVGDIVSYAEANQNKIKTGDASASF